MFTGLTLQKYLTMLMPFVMVYMLTPIFVPMAHGSLLPRLTYQNLQARNLSTFFNSIPTQCQVRCDIVVGAAHNCQYLACVCTREHALEFEDCVNCVVGLTPYADGIVEEYQAILDEWQNDYCGDFASPPLVVTLPGQSSSIPDPTPSSTSASAASSPSETATSASPSSTTITQVTSSALKNARSIFGTTLCGVTILGFISLVL